MVFGMGPLGVAGKGHVRETSNQRLRQHPPNRPPDAGRTRGRSHLLFVRQRFASALGRYRQSASDSASIASRCK